jgi:hypothetical protein
VNVTSKPKVTEIVFHKVLLANCKNVRRLVVFAEPFTDDLFVTDFVPVIVADRVLRRSFDVDGNDKRL